MTAPNLICGMTFSFLQDLQFPVTIRQLHLPQRSRQKPGLVPVGQIPVLQLLLAQSPLASQGTPALAPPTH
jgi:hypothetical protein